MQQTLRSVLVFCSVLFAMSVTAQVQVGATNYPTLKAAFDAINAGTHTGAITINITGSTVETSTAVLNASGTGSASYTSILITATAAAVISSDLAGATIRLDGADNVDLNGNSQLQIVNTNATGAVIHLLNGATNNIIRNATITGNTASYTGTATAPSINGGVITFGAGTANSGNTIDNCDINGNNQAICLVYSQGLTSSTAAANAQNSILNSRLYNFVNTTVAGSSAIFLNLGNHQWTVQGNSLYLTAPVTTPMQFVLRGILIVPTFTDNAHTVTGNFVGGSGPTATGAMMLNASGSNVLGLIALDVETGGAGNTVSNNIVRSIVVNYNSSAGSFANAGLFGFIGGYNGTSTFSGNQVSNVNITNNAGFVNLAAIHVNGRVSAAGAVTPTFNITNNTIFNVNGNAGGAGGDVNLMGIKLETSASGGLTGTSTSNPTFNVSGNTINNLSVPFSGAGTLVRGISTINTNGTGASPATALLYPKVNIVGNTIHGITTSSTLANYGGGAATGIHFGGASAAGTTDVQVISQNTIYDLSATNTGNVGAVVIGILATVGRHEITRNRIYDLKNAANPTGATAPGVVGITVRNAVGNSTTANNFISLGTNVPEGVQVFGFLQNLTATGPVNVLHNSIYIGGTATAGDKRSAAVVRGTELFATGITSPMNVRNNILYNARTGGGGSHYAIVNSEANPASGFSSDANVLYTVNPFTLAMWGATNNDLATYKTNSGDVHSRTTTVNFVNPAIGDLHLTGASVGDANLAAAPTGGITIDYDGDARPADLVYIGADEAPTPLPVRLVSFTGVGTAEGNLLTWMTASETNNRQFELQRSADGRNFTTIATIASRAADGNSATSLSYSYTDTRMVQGTTYYRLKQTDFDGRSSYAAEIVTIKRDARMFGVSAAYPNPVREALNLVITSPVNGRATISLMDISGKMISQQVAGLSAGENTVRINTAALVPGNYFLRIVNDRNEVGTVRFMKQ